MANGTLTPRPEITAAEIVAALEKYGYRKGSYVAEMGWEYDRATALSMAVSQVLSELRITSGPMDPTDFNALVARIVNYANQLLMRQKQVGQVLQ